MIFSYLRPETRPASRGVIPLMKLLLKHIRNRFPNIKIKLRADSGFAMPRPFQGTVGEHLVLYWARCATTWGILYISSHRACSKNGALWGEVSVVSSPQIIKGRL